MENLQRKDLNPIEKALSFKRYLDEHGCTQDDLARRIKIDRSTISNLMRLLELPAPVLEAIQTGAISAGPRPRLAPLGRGVGADRVLPAHSARRLECPRHRAAGAGDAHARVTNPPRADTTEPPRRKRTHSQQIASLQQELRMALGTKVEIRQASQGRGRIVIHFNSHEEFDRVRQLLTGTDPGHCAERRRLKSRFRVPPCVGGNCHTVLRALRCDTMRSGA